MKISALAVTVPKNKLGNDELEEKFGVKQAKRIAMITGIKERHVANDSVKALELMLGAAHAAIERAGGNLDFDAILVVTQTAEYKFPSTACIIQDKLGIKKNTLAYDINLGCSGFTYGLVSANAFIESKLFQRVLLIAGDLTQSTASSEDSATYPLFGDAFSAAVLEASDVDHDITAMDYGTDGSGAGNLITYVGGSRYPDIESYRNQDGYSKYPEVKYPNYVYMNGTKIFEFSVGVVPAMLNHLLSKSSHELSDIDAFYFHQANEFIIKHLCNKLDIDSTKVPNSIEQYGNTSGASIPLTICSHLGDNNSEEKLLTALIGFGVGYSWAGILLHLKPSIVVPIVKVE